MSWRRDTCLIPECTEWISGGPAQQRLIYFLVFILAAGTTYQARITSCNSFQIDALTCPHSSPSYKYLGGKNVLKKSSTSITSLSNKPSVAVSYHFFNFTFGARFTMALTACMVQPFMAPQEVPFSQSHRTTVHLTDVLSFPTLLSLFMSVSLPGILSKLSSC